MQNKHARVFSTAAEKRQNDYLAGGRDERGNDEICCRYSSDAQSLTFRFIYICVRVCVRVFYILYGRHSRVQIIASRSFFILLRIRDVTTYDDNEQNFLNRTPF